MTLGCMKRSHEAKSRLWTRCAGTAPAARGIAERMALLECSGAPAHAENWPEFRGPTGLTTCPTRWSPSNGGFPWRAQSSPRAFGKLGTLDSMAPRRMASKAELQAPLDATIQRVVGRSIRGFRRAWPSARWRCVVRPAGACAGRRADLAATRRRAAHRAADSSRPRCRRNKPPVGYTRTRAAARRRTGKFRPGKRSR